MSETIDICSLIKKGGVYKNIAGGNPKEIYKNISKVISLPEGLNADEVYEQLISREEILSTAVGKGISIPHPRHPILKDESEQRIAVCYLEKPVDMKAPDSRLVDTMFVLLSSSAQTHLNVLTQIASLFRDMEFRKLLDTQPDEPVLLEAIQKIIDEKK